MMEKINKYFWLLHFAVFWFLGGFFINRFISESIDFVVFACWFLLGIIFCEMVNIGLKEIADNTINTLSKQKELKEQ